MPTPNGIAIREDSFFDFRSPSLLSRFGAADGSGVTDLALAEMVFRFVSPIAVYFLADMEYKVAARSAMAYGRANLPADALRSLTEKGKLPRYPGDLDPGAVQDLYNETFAALAEQYEPGSEFVVDRYGAYGYTRPGGGFLAGDDGMTMPYAIGPEGVAAIMRDAREAV